jgi:uncharacterized protein DUF6328
MAAALNDKIENALNEARILILVAQVIIGLDFSSVFQKSFASLPEVSRSLKLGSLILMLTALALLISPAAFHRIVEAGHNSQRLHAFITRITDWALLPFALGLGMDLYVTNRRLFGAGAGVAAAGLGTGIALAFWYGIEAVARVRLGKKRRGMRERTEAGPKPTELAERIRNVLTEARVALPGAQALLGFQFLAVLTERFDELPEPGKTVHAVSLALIALTTVLLMTPAAWHRIVEEGENSERFHRDASVFLLVALVTLAAGIAGDLFVVLLAVRGDARLAAIASAAALLFFYGLWFGYTSFRRASDQK